MTNENTTYRKKANAVFFAAVMVVSMLAAGFAAAPAAAISQSNIDSTQASDIIFDEEETSQAFRVEWNSGAGISDGENFVIETDGLNSPVYTGISDSQLSASASGADAGNVTGVTAENDGSGNINVTVSTNGDTVDEVDITVLAEELDTTTLDPGIVATPTITSGPDFNDVEAVYDDNVETLNDGNRGFSGKEFQITNGTQLSNGDVEGQAGGVDNASRIDLYSVNDDREVGTLQSELTVDSQSDEPYVEISTEGLETGEYVVIFEGTGGTLETGDSVNDRAGNNTLLFQVTEQSLSTEFDDDSVTDAESTEVNVDSNRAGYNFVITSDDLDYDQLESIFGGNGVPTVAEGDQPRFDQNADDDEIIVEANDPLSADFANVDIDPGTYEFTFSATDSAAEDTASIDVSTEDVDGSFSQGVYTQTAGDVVEMSVELEDTDNGYIQLGDEDSGFVDILYVEDDDDDDQVTFQVNTRTLGTSANFDQVYDTEDDIVESKIHGDFSDGETLEFVDGDGDTLGSGTFSDYLNELDLVSSASDTGTDQLIRRLRRLPE